MDRCKTKSHFLGNTLTFFQIAAELSEVAQLWILFNFIKVVLIIHVDRNHSDTVTLLHFVHFYSLDFWEVRRKPGFK